MQANINGLRNFKFWKVEQGVYQFFSYELLFAIS